MSGLVEGYGLMRVDVYEGGNGEIVLCQEWPDIAGEKYLRVIVPLSQAEAVARQILSLVERLRNK